MGEGAAERKQKAMKEGRENGGKRDKKIKSRRRKRRRRKKKLEEVKPTSEERTKENAMPSAYTESRDWSLISVHLKETQTVNRGSPPPSLWAF